MYACVYCIQLLYISLFAFSRFRKITKFVFLGLGNSSFPQQLDSCGTFGTNVPTKVTLGLWQCFGGK